MAARLAADHVSKSFADQQRRARQASPLQGAGALAVLEDVDLEVGAGEFVSIIGPSGCGKSTLLNILTGLVPPTSGRILVDGRQSERLLGRVGHMPQRDLLMPWRTVLENTTLAMEIAGVPRRQAREAALAEFPRFGLGGFERRWPASLSGGMRQRTALLRTFLAGHEITLLDEPFGALDALTRQSMQAWLLRIWQEDRKTILLVTHDVEEAVYLSDRVYVMSARPGRMIDCLEIGLPRPRNLQMVLSTEFLAFKRLLLDPLRSAMPDEAVEGA